MLTYVCMCVLIMYMSKICDWNLDLCVLIMYTQHMWLKCWPTCACVCWLCIPEVYDWHVDQLEPVSVCVLNNWFCTPSICDWNVDQLVPVSVHYAHPKYVTEMTPACACVYWLCTPRICDWNVGQLVPVYTLYDDVAGRCHWDVELPVLVCMYYQKVRLKCWPTFAYVLLCNLYS